MSERYQKYDKKYYENNKIKIYKRNREYNKNWYTHNKEYYKTKYHRYYNMFNGARHRAKKRGIPFDLKFEDINIPDNCALCGKQMIHSNKAGGDENSPTLDRVHPERGYIKNNVAVICKQCNRKKQDTTIEELKRILEWMETFSN